MSTQTYEPTTFRGERVASDRPAILTWSAVFAGGVLAIGLVYLFNLLWNALAFSSNRAWFADNLAWLNAATSVAVLLLAGVVAGWLVNHRSMTLGLLHGVTVWGVLIAGTVALGLGSALPLTTLSQANAQVSNASPGSFWPSFVAFSVGLVAAGIGGMIGGMFLPPTTRMFHVEPEDIDLRERPVTTTRVSAGRRAEDDLHRRESVDPRGDAI